MSVVPPASVVKLASCVPLPTAAKKVVVVKSMQHFHAAYAPVASEILYVAVPGTVAPDFLTMPYIKASKQQWPFVEDPFAKG